MACTGAPTPEPAPPAPPTAPLDLVLVIVDDLAVDALPDGQPAWSVTDDAARSHRHILTATYSGERPNTLPQVLSLYGLRTALFVGPDFAARDPWLRETADHLGQTDGCLATALRDAATWRDQTAEQALVVLHAAAACPPTAADWAALPGADEAEVWVIGASAGGAGLGAAGTRTALRAPLSVPDASTLDLLPTLLAGAGATIPSDARGRDLRSPDAAPRRALFLTDAEGQTVAIRTSRHLLAARPNPEGDALVPLALEDAATGAPLPLEDADLAPLLQALSAWRQSLSATSARERMGDDAFSRILQDGGYWEAPPTDKDTSP